MLLWFFCIRLGLGSYALEFLQWSDCNLKGFKITLVDARFVKPLDTKLLDQLLNNHEFILTIEEGSIGGFSSIVLDYVHNRKIQKNSSHIENLIFPDKFINHNKPENQYQEIGMDAKSIENKILSMIAPKEVDLKVIKNL